MTVPEAKLPKPLADLSSRENISESVILSTCNRIEIYAYAEKFHGAYQDIRNFLSEISHVAPEEFSDHLIGLFGNFASGTVIFSKRSRGTVRWFRPTTITDTNKSPKLGFSK
jgi:hypothetical protein